jgi:uncharacterized lipoprotein NlpE involved in copper resistance
MKKTLLTLFITLFTLTGCMGQPEAKNANERPSWILNPNQNGKSGAVGVAARTYDQKVSTKRTLAITRALDELSLQQGVKVELNLNKQETVVNDRSNTVLDTQSSYQSSSTVSAHIEDVWEDKITGELYIWMVLD